MTIIQRLEELANNQDARPAFRLLAQDAIAEILRMAKQLCKKEDK